MGNIENLTSSPTHDREMKKELMKLLSYIESVDPSNLTEFEHARVVNSDRGNTAQDYYDKRNNAIHKAIAQAKVVGFTAGYAVHRPVQDIIDKNWDETWGVVAFIELPTGQISWHIESPSFIYDGHGYEEKTQRINKYIKKEMKNLE